MKKNFLIYLFLLFALVSLLSCRTDPKPATTTPLATEPVLVRSRIRAEPTSLIPFRTTQAIGNWIIEKMYQSLLNFDPHTKELRPVLATQRPIISDIDENDPLAGKKYVYEIKEEATWGDGKAVTADDYIFTLKVVKNPKMTGATALYGASLDAIQKVEKDKNNPKKFTVYVSPYNFRGEYLTGGFYILPEHIFDPEGLLKDLKLNDLLNPDKAEILAEENENLELYALQFYDMDRMVSNGSGAYHLTEWNTGEQILLEKKKQWWGEDYAQKENLFKAYPKKISFIPIPDMAPAEALLRNEELDAIRMIPNTTFLKLREDESLQKNYNFYTPDNLTINYLALNTSKDQLKDKRVRQAIAYTVDTDEIIKTIKQGMAEKIASVVPSDFDYYNDSLQPYSLDLKKASQLLAEAGWTDTNGNGIVDKNIDGKTVELSLDYLFTAGSDISNDIALINKENAKRIGIDLQLLALERKTFVTKVRANDFDLYPGGYTLSMDQYDMYQQWHTASRGNRWKFGDATSDAWIDKINTTQKEDERKTLYLKLQEKIHDEVPMVLLYKTKDCVMIHKRFGEIEMSIVTSPYYENEFQLQQ